MQAEILRIEKHASKLSERGYFFYIFFRDLFTLKSYKTCVYEKFRNYQNWRDIIAKGIGTKLDNLVVKGKFVDADSIPKIINV